MNEVIRNLVKKVPALIGGLAVLLGITGIVASLAGMVLVWSMRGGTPVHALASVATVAVEYRPLGGTDR